jgi:hypothetical protein
VSDRESNVIQLSDRQEEREVVLPNGSTVTVQNAKMSIRDLNKIGFPEGYAESKAWRTHVLRFYNKAARFEYDHSYLNHIQGVAGQVVEREFEPCMMGAVVSTDDGELVFRTDRGNYHVQYGGKLSLRRMLHRMDVDKKGICQTFCKLFQKSLNKHGWMQPIAIHSTVTGGEE